MIARIFSLLVLVAFFSGGAWYIFRDTPEKQILRWRNEAEKILFDKAADLERAEELNGKILKLVPHSAHDLLFKAKINERKGTPQGLKQAIEAYDKVLSSGDRGALGVAFMKARACRSLGLLTEAKGTLFSVVDVYPFESMMQLGETALSLLAAKEAIRYFSKALEVASSKSEEARAHEGMVNTYKLLLTLRSGAFRGIGLDDAGKSKEDPDGAKALVSLRESYRISLQKVLELVKDMDLPASADEANRRILWALSLYEKLSAVKDSGEKPCSDACLWADLKIRDYRGILKTVSPEVTVRLGSLRLQAAREEMGRDTSSLAASYTSAAEKGFLEALGHAPEEARALLAKLKQSSGSEPEASGSQDKAVLQYLESLLLIAKDYLASPDFRRLLDDPSPLSLSTRIGDVIGSQSSEGATIFSLISGLARMRAGDFAEADGLLEKYLMSLLPEARPRAALDLAEQVLRLRPSDPFVFKYLDRFAQFGGKPLDLIGRRVALLVSACAREALASDASRWLEAVIKDAGEQAESAAERVAFARILYRVRGRDVAIGFIRETRDRYPDDSALERVLADLLLEKGNASLSSGDKEGAVKAYRDAMGGYLPLFLRAPAESQEVLSSIVEVLEKLEEKEEDLIVASVLKKLFPSAPPPAVDVFGFSLLAFFHRKFGPALDRATSLTEPRAFEPFLSFLKGSCHAGLMIYLQQDAAKASSGASREGLLRQMDEHLKSAIDDFKSHEDFLANKIELAYLEFQALPPGQDVPEDLFRRSQELSQSEKVEHRGDFLFARALRRRFEQRYGDNKVKNSELAKLVAREQKALRSAIRRKPTFAPAYLALAETFLVSERVEQGNGASGGATFREMFAPDFQKGINILKAVPAPDEHVMARLVDCLEATGRLDEAARRLEQLALHTPEASYFSRLLALYLQTKDLGLTFLLEEKEPAKEPSERVSKERLQLLLMLRKSFEGLSEHEPLRYSTLGMVAAKKEAEASSDAEKKQLRDQVIDNYTRALDSYDAKGLAVPIVVLNNLAWYLAEDSDEERCLRSLQVAHRAKGLARSPAQMPEVYDTYAWALFRNRRLIEAEAAFRSLLEVVDAPTFHYHIALVLFDLRKFDEALSHVRNALESSHPFPEQSAARRLEGEIREARRNAVGEQERHKK